MKKLIASLAVILPLVLIPQAQAARAAITIDQPAPTYGDGVTFSVPRAGSVSILIRTTMALIRLIRSLQWGLQRIGNRVQRIVWLA
jgi:hypothetical protein